MNNPLKLISNNKQIPEGKKKYTVNEIFYSIQGEGVRAGTANLFIRFSGCNLECTVETHGFDCDTEFRSGRALSGEEILEQFRHIAPEAKWVICTGGEPLLQLDDALCSLLKEQGYQIAVETNGSVMPTDGVMEALDWITCSPKVAEHALRLTRCDELKYVRAYGQGVPKPKLKDTTHKILSPAFSGDQMDRETLQWCIQLVKENPEWRLSVQQHKAWKIR